MTFIVNSVKRNVIQSPNNVAGNQFNKKHTRQQLSVYHFVSNYHYSVQPKHKSEESITPSPIAYRHQKVGDRAAVLKDPVHE